MTDATFLAGRDLSEAIRSVLIGRDVRCAVAFPGRGFGDLLGDTRSSAKIVCDIIQGATSAKALVELGAPGNDALRRCDHLHAKVYLSDRGVVIGSANPSNNGIGFGGADRPRLLEAGVLHPPGGGVHGAVAAWFDTLFVRSLPIREPDLRLAERLYRPPREAAPSVSPSLFDRILDAPEVFSGIGFVLVSTQATEKAVTDAKVRTAKAYPADSNRIQGWSKNDMFTGWAPEEISRWPRHFIEFWVGARGGLTIIPRVVEFAYRRELFARRDSRAIEALNPGALPPLTGAAALDAPRAVALREKNPNFLFRTAGDLRNALLELEG